jgi:glycolate oxidase FAD binding subunit
MPMTADSIPGPLADACDQVRLAGPADAVAGVRPALVAAPATAAQAGAVMKAAAGLGLTVIPRGTGSKLSWGNPPQRADLIVDLTRMREVIEHAAGDLVVTVQAGVTMEQLAAVLAPAGQRLALDFHGTGGTVGGVTATNVAGPLRLRYGTPRDLLIGITIVRADGTVAKAGGKVVKNVAGYDLGKLFAGSRGTLGVITQATFRLHPVPAATAYVTTRCVTPADCGGLLLAAQQPAIAPVAAELYWPSAGEPVSLGVAVEGDPAGVAARSGLLFDLLAAQASQASTEVADRPPYWWGSGAAAQPDGTVLQVAFWAARLGAVLTEIRAAARQADLDPVISGSAAAGLLHVAVPAAAAASQVADLVTSLRAALSNGDAGQRGAAPARASVLIRQAPAPVAERVDLFGPVPSLGLMRAVKQQFDPGRVLSPGRFAGGI